VFKDSTFRFETGANVKLPTFVRTLFTISKQCHHTDDVLMSHCCKNYILIAVQAVDNSDNTSHIIISCFGLKICV